MRMHKDLNVLKWSAAASALAIALIGCAGNGGTSSGTGGSATGTTGGLFPTVASVNLPDTPGYAQLSFLTGAGRGPNSSAVIRRAALKDVYGIAETSLQAEKLLVFTNYNSQILPLNIPNVLGQSSRNFSTFEFDFVSYTSATGSVFNSITGLPKTLTADVRIFPGRQTHVPVFFDQDVITVATDGTGATTATFDSNHFDAINYAPGDAKILKSILSDYVSFDISQLGDKRPLLSDGSAANRLFFSGDSYALTAGDPYLGVADFEQLIPAGQDNVVIGRVSGPASIPNGGGASTQTPGTYSLLQSDPTDIINPIPRRITGLQGTWKEHFKQVKTTSGILDLGYLKNVHTVEAIAIPGSDDGVVQDVIWISQTLTTNPDGTTTAVINDLYWGFVDYDKGTISVYPASELPKVNSITESTPQFNGTITGQFTGTGAGTSSSTQTRYANFNFSSAPSGFPTSGTLVVLRR